MSKDNYEYKRRSSSLKRSRTSSKRSRSDSTHREDSIKYRTRSRSRSNRNRSPVPRHSENYRPNPIENPDRQNPTRNNILAVFGLDREVTERDLYYMYKNFGCKQCKVIIDKKVISNIKIRLNSFQETFELIFIIFFRLVDQEDLVLFILTTYKMHVM